jgi:hypothetical protein
MSLRCTNTKLTFCFFRKSNYRRAIAVWDAAPITLGSSAKPLHRMLLQ